MDDAAGVIKGLSTIGDKITSESQARKLAKVEPEARTEVVTQAAAKLVAVCATLFPFYRAIYPA